MLTSAKVTSDSSCWTPSRIYPSTRFPRSSGGYAPSHAAVVQTFATYGARAVVVKGVVPESLDQISSERIAFLSLDMNLREPEIAAAERLWPRLVSGATMLLDDYGWRRHEEQKQAFDEFAARHRVPLLALPTGQALIIKI